MVSELERLKEENETLRKAHMETNNELIYFQRINSDLNEQIINKNIEIAELKISLNKYEQRTQRDKKA